ncbi:MAG: 50S ribosomal protein L9 [Chloroflexi bacterium]|nr:50S ribosomal protein L9 [Chloroflexota bacterium]
MNVILLQDVPDLGQAGEIKKVANGYARNFLIPKGLVSLASPGALKQAEIQRQAQERRRKLELADAQSQAEAISAVSLTFTVKTGESDRLYGSVTSADIAEALSEQLGKEIDKRKLTLPDPIKNLGTYRVPIRLMTEVVPEVLVNVVKEDGGETTDSDAGE